MKTYQKLIKITITLALAVWMAVSFFIVAGDNESMSAADFFVSKAIALVSLAAAVLCARWAWRNGLTIDIDVEGESL